MQVVKRSLLIVWLLSLHHCFRRRLRYKRLALLLVDSLPVGRLARLPAVEGAPALNAHVQRRAVLPQFSCAPRASTLRLRSAINHSSHGL